MGNRELLHTSSWRRKHSCAVTLGVRSAHRRHSGRVFAISLPRNTRRACNSYSKNMEIKSLRRPQASSLDGRMSIAQTSCAWVEKDSQDMYLRNALRGTPPSVMETFLVFGGYGNRQITSGFQKQH